MRINKFLASAGLGSRRACEALVTEGRVTINGHVCIILGTLIAPGDHVKVDGKIVKTEPQMHILMNKPRGVVCSADDEQGRRTIFDLIDRPMPRLFHVGRLDKESEGLIILTNDGELALKLTHPRYKLEKEYEVTLDKALDMELATKLRGGMYIEGGRARMESVTQPKAAVLRVVLLQGIKRQIRLMLYKVGYEVERLKRIRIGPLRDPELPTGSWRFLAPEEVKKLLAAEPRERPQRPAVPAGAKPAGKRPVARSARKTAPRRR